MLRTRLVKQAFSRKADILFMLDDDAVPAIGTFRAFVEHISACGEPIAACYTMWGGGVVPIGCNGDDRGHRGWYDKRHLEPTQIAGTHCIAYPMNMF